MKKYLLLLCVAVLGFASCSEMNDTHIKYRNEDIYSGKVSNVRGYPGIGNASIAWDNPSDYKSKKIFIEYYCYEDSVKTWFSDSACDPETGKMALDSITITGLKNDMAYVYKVYTLDNENNKSIADSVVVQNKTIKSLRTLIGPSVDSKIDSSSGVDSVFVNIAKLTDNSQYVWNGDLAFEVYQDITDADGKVVGTKIVYSEDHIGLPNKTADGKNYISSYKFCPGKIEFKDNQARFDVAVHIGMQPVVKNGLSSENVIMSDSFTWDFTFSQLLLNE
ncbi:MAG: hypothetical protein IJ014_05825 [Rikenellaceae bacterium]|nr:hypothetical protein [Rikenellaceae bacterium]